MWWESIGVTINNLTAKNKWEKIPTGPICSAGSEKWIEKYYLKGIAGAKINGHESQPNDAGGVHGKTNEFGLVEIFRDLKKSQWNSLKVFFFRKCDVFFKSPKEKNILKNYPELEI